MGVDRFPVEEGSIMLFARAIGDPNSVYRDPAAAASSAVGGIIAPPTYVQASAQFDPDYPLRPSPPTPWFGSGRNPTGVVGEATARAGGQTLHAEQHFEFHRVLRPGDVLSATQRVGDTWEKEGRSGRLRFNEAIVEYRTADGVLAVTARGVSVTKVGADG